MRTGLDATMPGSVCLVAAFVFGASILSGCGKALERRQVEIGEEEHEEVAAAAPSAEARASFELTSPAFWNKGAIPSKYTADGPNVSPPLNWGTPPAGTQALALLCDDQDSRSGEWSHWVLYDIPASVSGLPENLPAADIVLETARQGRNDFGLTGYGGPAPPRGNPHNYRFTLFALDAPTKLPGRVTRRHVLRAIEGHVLAKTELIGTYER